MAIAKVLKFVSHWELSEEEEKLLISFTSVKDKNYFFKSNYRLGIWDGIVKFYNPKSKTLPVGLLPEAVDFLKSHNYNVEVLYSDDLINPTRENTFINFDLDLKHQVPALESMLGSRFGVVNAATNSGKTKIAEAWCAVNKLKTIYFVPTKELLLQTVNSFRKDINLKVGFISSDDGWEIGEDVTVCLITSVIKRKSKTTGKLINEETVARFMKLSKLFEAVIVDECHHLTAETWRWAVKQCSNARRRFGLSGTPWQDPKSLDAFYVKSIVGPELIKISNSDLIEKGWSARPIIHMIELPGQEKHGPDFDLDFQVASEKYVYNNDLRNNLILSICQKHVALNESCLIITNRIDHAATLSQFLKLKSLTYRVILGTSAKEERKQDLKDFKDNKYSVLISTVLGEGVDIPSLNCIVMASGGKSFKQILQKIGRGVRKKNQGENFVHIYDFKDKINKYLDKHCKKRLRIYKDEQFQILEETLGF